MQFSRKKSPLYWSKLILFCLWKMAYLTNLTMTKSQIIICRQRYLALKTWRSLTKTSYLLARMPRITSVFNSFWELKMKTLSHMRDQPLEKSFNKRLFQNLSFRKPLTFWIKGPSWPKILLKKKKSSGIRSKSVREKETSPYKSEVGFPHLHNKRMEMKIHNSSNLPGKPRLRWILTEVASFQIVKTLKSNSEDTFTLIFRHL